MIPVPPGAAAALVLALAAAVLVCALVALRRRYLVITVRGASMEPALTSGDRVLVDRRRRGSAAVGDLVALRHAGQAPAAPGMPAGAAGMFVKRVAAVGGEPIPPAVPLPPGGARTVPPGTVVLLGDAHYSLDSRAWGCVPAEWIVGVVVRRLGAASHHAAAGRSAASRR